MRFRLLLALSLSCAALSSPGLASAQTDVQQRAQKQLLLIASRAHYQMQLAQVCKMPDEARQTQMSAALNTWLEETAHQDGVSAERLAQEAAEARRRADNAYPGVPPEAVCRENAQSLITLSGG